MLGQIYNYSLESAFCVLENQSNGLSQWQWPYLCMQSMTKDTGKLPGFGERASKRLEVQTVYRWITAT